MSEKCLACVYNSDGTRNYRYAEDGTDLTVPPIPNPNPLDIVVPPGRTVGDIVRNWNNFYSFIRKVKNFNTTNPILNSAEGRKNITTQLLNEYNNNEIYHTKFKYLKPHPLNQEDIRAIQTFTKITDSNVIIDGFLGTQTIQMEYPREATFEQVDKSLERWLAEDSSRRKEDFPQSEINKLSQEQQLLFITPNDGDFVPHIWGNKRYVVTWRQYLSSFSTYLDKPLLNLLVPYDPSIHNPIIPRYTPKNWDAIGENAIINQPASLKNIVTQQIQVQKATQQLKTNLTNSLTKIVPR
jgi:hypothetical protein